MRPRNHPFDSGVIKGTRKRGEAKVSTDVEIKANQSTKQIT